MPRTARLTVPVILFFLLAAGAVVIAARYGIHHVAAMHYHGRPHVAAMHYFG